MYRARMLVLGLGLVVSACSAAEPNDVESQEQEAVSDIVSMTARGDGSYDVKCRDGRTEVVTAHDVERGRVCKPPASSPFERDACTGAPMTAADAMTRLSAAGEGPITVGSYSLALRRRETEGRGWYERFVWVDAPNDALSAWRDTGVSSSSGRRAVFPSRGRVELGKDPQGTPWLRLVSEAVNDVGPDTTRWLRLVSRPIQRWPAAAPALAGPEFEIESKVGDGAWTPVTEYGWSVQTTEFHLIGTNRSWWFEGTDITAIVTNRCGQFVSSQPTGGLAATRAAIGIAITLD